MERAELIGKTNKLLAEEFEVEEQMIRPEANIKSTLALSSLELVDFVAVIDYEFGVKIAMTELVELVTVAQIYDYLEKKLEEK